MRIAMSTENAKRNGSITCIIGKEKVLANPKILLHQTEEFQQRDK